MKKTMKFLKNACFFVSFLFISLLPQTSYGQSGTIDPTIPAFSIMEFSAVETLTEAQQQMIDNAFTKTVDSTVTYYANYDDDSQLSTSTKAPIAFSGFGDGNMPANMADKTSLKPIPGNFTSNMLDLHEDLNSGTVGITIPLFEFEYYDFKMPVYINTKYPQKIKSSFGEPVFYANSRIGGGWTLPIDQYKVSRTVNGVADEDTAKGYFTTTSQSKINNPNAMTAATILSGIKNEWDPALDVFSFSAPTVSGSFVVTLNDNSFQALTSGNFAVKYTRSGNKLTSFTVTDENGIEYLFGGSDATTEISQSQTNMQMFGLDPGMKIKYIIEAPSDPHDGVYRVRSASGAIPFTQNLYASSAPEGTLLDPINPETLRQQIVTRGHLTSDDMQRMYYLGNGVYGIPWSSALRSQKFEEVTNDANLRGPATNTGWYLNQIKLLNGKKITFRYYNYWTAFQTFGANKVGVNKGNGYNYTVDGRTIFLPYTYSYPCMPSVFSSNQFPVNEVMSETVNYVKKPKLIEVADEDNISSIYFYNNTSVTQKSQPYITSPTIYPNMPSDMYLSYEQDPKMLNRITFNRGMRTMYVNFEADVYPYIIGSGPDARRFPWKESSSLRSVTINNSKKYEFINGSGSMKIKYPTGGTKEFFGTTRESEPIDFHLTRALVPSIVFGTSVSTVNKIITTPETPGVNTTVEDFEYSDLYYLDGVNSNLKTYRPTVQTCLARATYSSSGPIYNSFITKGAPLYSTAKKFVNSELQLESKVIILPDNVGGTFSTFVNNDFYLSGGTTTTYTPIISTPLTVIEEHIGIAKSLTTYKKDRNNNTVQDTQSYFTYAFNDGTNLPNLFLYNVEAGPWGDTTGAIKRGFSRYNIRTRVDVTQVTKEESSTFDTGIIRTSTQNSFTRFRYLSDLNVLKNTRSHSSADIGKYMTTYYNFPENSTQIDRTTPLFQYFRSHNMAPMLESYKQTNINDWTDFKVWHYETHYTGIQERPMQAVLRSVKELEADVLPYPHLNYAKIKTDRATGIAPDYLIYDPKLKDRIVYDLYDNYGKLLQFHVPDGTYTAVVWDYSRQFPIAKFENAKYADITAYIPGRWDTDQQIRDLFNTARTANPNWMISNYTYARDYGMTSSTDTRGETTFYEYDESYRLKAQKDADGNIIKQYEYHFKSPN